MVVNEGILFQRLLCLGESRCCEVGGSSDSSAVYQLRLLNLEILL
jgi:hypothetical protein